MSGNSSGPLESSGGGVGGSGEEEKDMKMEETGEGAGDGGSRWPRPETLALLRLRSEMDKAFRDSTLKAPLWEEISRKMMELGYKRSAKKCKEKFENVYKYHKRTKEGRTGKSEGKTYRFFEELEAFETLNSYQHEPESQLAKSSAAVATAAITTSLIPCISSNNPSTEKSSLPLKHQHQVSVQPITTNPTFHAKQPSATMPFPFYSNNNTTTVSQPPSISNDLMNNVSSLHLFSSSTSSSTASDEEEDHHQGKRSRKRRKYWKGFFTKLTKELMDKQEKMQKRFLETLENREKERISREEAWRVQEIARINREHETLIHERSNAAAKDAAIISFLHKISGGQQQQPQQQNHKPAQRKQYQSDHSITFESKEPRPVLLDTTMKMGNYDTNQSISPSSSRWPKTEVEALIRIRKNLEANYQENGTKGPLWEEISAGMRRLGYNRSAKRCKEKWENINKYFKKVKESNKKRPLDSKTCPYFHQLEALYNERNKSGAMPLPLPSPLMVTPQRQLLLSQENQTEFETDQRDKVGDKEDDEEGESEEDEYDDEEEGEGDNETSEFETVLKKTSSPMDINNNLFT
ncbi:PREDICTED: trihelix transcription factor GT-2 [Camelina sativa]|uniref:Trihelix transcription factor GT-2 n=1 Tax=Camelina sativa TaxID=90675 RepID=A0ABM0WJ85_CAMSA|nr:PREDICTED: trihelix transcription factor GT-2 [Camelina sativa]